ncbi:HERV-H LTR-associating protein 2 [Mantella aurantiaca]
MKLLLFLQIFRLFSFVHSTPTVIGELHGVIILPCSFPPGKGEVIHWTIADNGKQKVHSFYEGKDHIEAQDKIYAGRTSLFLDQVRNGNASLQLRNLQKSDANKYSCYAATTEKNIEFTVLLKVEAAVWGEQHKNVTIPCSFNPGEGVVIYWKTTSDEQRIVHSYYQDQDMLDRQDKSYKGRTSLFLSELAKGNASLQIRDLQEGDTNTYSCYVGTIAETKEDKVKLYVADFGHSIEYSLDHDGLQLKCCASHVYPSDAVTIEWYEGNLKKQQDKNSSSLCSFCNLTNSNSSYKCIIQHSVVQTTWTGMWKTHELKQDSFEFACTLYKNISAEMSVRLYLRKNTTVVLVASTNSSSRVISDGYGSRISGKQEEYSLHLNNLTDKDNGDYICEIRTPDEMFISMTSVNITAPKRPIKAKVSSIGVVKNFLSIWAGPKELIQDFVYFLNALMAGILFNPELSSKGIVFLDVEC